MGMMGLVFPLFCANISSRKQSLVIFPEIVLNLPRARHAIVAAKLDISQGSVLNKKVAVLPKVECAVQVPTVTSVPFPRDLILFLGGKIGHIARNCPMNEGGYAGGGGFGGQQGYNDSGKTCYACGGFGKKKPLSYPSNNTQATWQKTAVRAKNVTTVVAWDMSVAIAIKLRKQKFATGAFQTNLVC